MSEIIQRIYRDCDFNVLPCGDTKKPLERWKKWQTKRVDVETLCRWSRGGPFTREDGSTFTVAPSAVSWAVMTGQRPWTNQAGVVVLDADDVEAMRLVERQCPTTPMRTSTPRGGMHYYYRHPGEHIGQIIGMTNGGRKFKLDRKGDGNYVIAPGTISKKGMYAWERPWTPELVLSLPIYQENWIPQPTKWITKKTSEKLLATTKHNSPASVRSFLASRWLARQPGARQGEGADSYCLGIATRLVFGFGCDEEDAVELLVDWGARADQLDSGGSHYPWSVSECRHKIRDAIGGQRWTLPGDLYLSELDMYQTERTNNIISDACGIAD